MSVSTNYPMPVTVNGYSCKNCTDVDYAKKNIDPAHPKDGPYGVDKTDKGPRDVNSVGAAKASDPASASGSVTFGGVLAGHVVQNQPPNGTTPAQGGLLDIST